MQTKEFPGRFASLCEIAEFVQQAAQETGLSDFDTYAVETAVDEACSNIIEHAYGGENKGTIECVLEPQPGALTIILKDHGKSFDPKLIKPPDLRCPLEERKDHGLGLYFIYQWMDQVSFSHEGDRNVLTMVKRKHKDEKSSGQP
jgi:serine/threonine-protein kinase RsbW